MNIAMDIYNFIALHKAAFGISFLWATREWSTVGGWRGLKYYFLTGKTTMPENPAQQTKV